jgi:hypothetical protein
LAAAFAATTLLGVSGTAHAQSNRLTTHSSQRGLSDLEVMEWQPEADSIELPKVNHNVKDATDDKYDKYFFFHRTETTFAEALADLRECDNLSRDLSGGSVSAPYYPSYWENPYLYGGSYDNYSAGAALGGAIGAAIGMAIAMEIAQETERRRIRRVNMRRCMGFKGYDRYGTSQSRWRKFNFEGGDGEPNERRRQHALAQQAKLASGPLPEESQKVAS